MNSRLLEMAMLAMDSAAFENLVFALVHVDEPPARQLRPPDAGRDTIVPATEGRRERAWQAKHHTAGVNWGKCEESLRTALRERDPGQVTFMFPGNMTAGQEPGLEDLRARYPQVELPEPWTLGTLREKLAAHPDIRREHIDRIIGLDHEFAERMFERGAGLREGWDTHLDAAVRGPLVVLGQDQAATEAHAAEVAGDWGRASASYEEVAATVTSRMPSVADVLLMRAARAAAEGGDCERAADLYLRASRGASERGDSAAEYAAFRASWLLGDADRWRSFAATARAAWPERPDESLPVLKDAFERCLSAGDVNRVAEWGAAASEALAASGRWVDVHDVAGRAVTVLGAVQDRGPRLRIELDLLDARSELGEDVDADFNELLLGALGRDDATQGLLRARWGVLLARRGRADDATMRFDEAASRWRAAGDGEEEVAEALLSADAAAALLGTGRTLDQPERLAVADLRGRVVTATVIADRKETEGLRAWLEERGFDARRALTVAWTLHRRAGHLAGTMRLAVMLHALFKGAGEPDETLTWAIRTGRQLAARQAAQQLGWERTRSRLLVSGAPWERGASFEAVAVTATTASDNDVAHLIGPLLETAADHDANELRGVIASAAARRALATLLCAIPTEHFDAALAEVLFETEHTPFPPRDTTQGLIFATDAGRTDQSALIAEIFTLYDRAHVPGFTATLTLIGRSPEARAHVAKHAERSFTALVLAAWLDLPDEHDALRTRVSEVLERDVNDQSTSDEILRHNDRGRLARWATDDEQRRVAAAAVAALADHADLGPHRYEAGEGLAALAERMSPTTASVTLDDLLTRRENIVSLVPDADMSSHPNRLFARVKMNAPANVDAVRSVALRCAVLLANRSARLTEVRDEVDQALSDSAAPVRHAAAQLSLTVDGLRVPDLDVLVNDADKHVRALALAALSERGQLVPDDTRLLAAFQPGQPFTLRVAALGIVREAASTHPSAVTVLRDDPHVYVRTSARAVT